MNELKVFESIRRTHNLLEHTRRYLKTIPVTLLPSIKHKVGVNKLLTVKILKCLNLHFSKIINYTYLLVRPD